MLESAISNHAVTGFISAHRDDIALVVVSNPFRKHGDGGIHGVIRHIRNTGPSFLGFLAYSFFLYPVFLEIGCFISGILGISRQRTPVRKLCRKLGLKYLFCNDINSTKAVALMKEQRIDLIITCFFDQVLGRQIISAANKVCLNVHPGLLPENRGVLPEFHVAAGKSPGFGVTIHVIDSPAIDTGKIISRIPVEVGNSASMLAIGRKLLQAGMTALSKILIDLDAGLANAEAQGPGNYFSYPSREDINNLRRAGFRLASLPELCSDAVNIFRYQNNAGKQGHPAD